MEGLSKGPAYVGDFGTPEQQIPATGLPGEDWESCMTMNDTWGYKYFGDNWKSTPTLLQNLIDIASKGGNYLLNVGPTAEGLIPEQSVVRLKEMGNWLDKYGDAIYATTASPFEKPAWGRFTQKEGKIYAHIFEWPADSVIAVPLAKENIKRALLIGQFDALELEIEAQNQGSVIHLPETAPDEIGSVVVIETE